MLLETLDANFPTEQRRSDDAAETWRLRQSFLTAVQTLRSAGIVINADTVDGYLAKRHRWEPRIRHVAPTLGYDMADVDRRSAGGRDAPEP